MITYVHHSVIRNSEKMESMFSQISIENSLNKLQWSHAMECCYADLKIIMKINTPYEEKCP